MQPAHMVKHFIPALAAVLLSAGALYSASLNADPDHISSGYEFRGTPCVRIGDSFTIPRVSLGAMIEVRDEEQFNQAALPNHDWRGFFSVYGRFEIFSGNDSLTLVETGYEHESAHPIAGLTEPYRNLYDTIYDGTYRSINLNSAMLRVRHSAGDGYALNLMFDTQLYFFSRNTPELSCGDLGWSGGVSGGAEIILPVTPLMEVFFSVFDRYIFRGPVEKKGPVWEKQGGSFVQVERLYPVMNEVNTVTARTGIMLVDIVPGWTISVYCGFLHGNMFGFTDSRDTRNVYSAGIEFTRQN